MKNRLTPVSMVLTVLLLGAILTACGAQPEPSATPGVQLSASPVASASAEPAQATATRSTSTPQPTATATPIPISIDAATLNGTEIRFLYPWIGDVEESVDGLIARFNAENQWGIRVTGQSSGGTGVMFETLSNSDDATALAQAVVLSASEIDTWLADGSELLNLSPYLADAQYGMAGDTVAGISNAFQAQFIHYDSLYGLPVDQDLHVLFYNKTWAEELGFPEPPQTMADFESQACAASKALAADDDPNNDGMGGWVLNYDAGTVMSWLAAYGSPNVASATPERTDFDSGENVQAYTALRKLYDSNCLWQSRLTTSETYFSNRQALFYSGTLADVALQHATHTRLGKSDYWTLIPYPADSGKGSVLSEGSALAVIPSTPEKDLAAWLFIAWLSQPEQAAQLTAAGGWLPVNQLEMPLLGDYAASNAPWTAATTMVDSIQPMPQTKSWRVVYPILEDSFRQLFRPLTTVDRVPGILGVLDDTIQDVIKQSR